MPIRVIVTQGTTADCTQAAQLIEGLSAEYLLADTGYDSDAIVEQAIAQGMSVVIPPAKTEKSNEVMTSTSTGTATSLRTHFCISNAGGVSLRATLKTPHHSWLQSAYAALRFG